MSNPVSSIQSRLGARDRPAGDKAKVVCACST
jgi:hypothetical protein